MGTAEQPLKKRRLHEPTTETQPPQPSAAVQNETFCPNLSAEEIARRRRNKEEIRNMYDCYKRIKFCVSQKNAHLMPDLEQAYLSLITASRGCTSVQRIVADIIPRYASYCPTALEAVAKVVINMHNWSMTVINRGDDGDCVAFQTAKSCIFGLADICRTASSEAPTSSVIKGICSAVFLNVLSFFISSFEGQEIFQIVDTDITKMQDSPEFFTKFKQKFSGEDGLASSKLSKFRALCLLWVFFCCPRNSLAACFELFISSSTEGVCNGGEYFLSQLTRKFDVIDVAYPLDGDNSGVKLSTLPVERRGEGKEVHGDEELLDDNTVSRDAHQISKHSLLGMALCKDLSLRRWILSRFKKLRKKASPQDMSSIASALEETFKSFANEIEAEEKQIDSDEDDFDPSKFICRKYLVPKISNQRKALSESSERDGSYHDDVADQFSAPYPEHRSSLLSVETDFHSNTSSNIDNGGSKSIDLASLDHIESHARSSMPRDLLNNQMLSPMSKNPIEARCNSFEGRNHSMHIEGHVPILDCSVSAMNSSAGAVNYAFESSKHHLPAKYTSMGQITWCYDGSPMAMDVFPASGQLWLGSLGPDSSEALVRFQFEKFGAINKFLYFPFKGFVLIEYKHIMDAIKAREVMRGRSPWGACLDIKFLDIGFGTRGDINGIVIGSSCHVYIENLPNQGAKDEILYEMRKMLYKNPIMVNDLIDEGALLVEFETPEEAATVMAHLRQWRKEKYNLHQHSNVCPTNFMMTTEQERHVDLRNVNSGNRIASSSHSQTVLEYSHPGKHHSNHMDLTSPRISSVNQGATVQGGHAFQSQWIPFSGRGTPHAGARKADSYDTSMAIDPSHGGDHIASGTPEQTWMYRKPESALHSAPGNIPSISSPTHGHNITPPQPMEASPFMRPAYYPRSSSWDARTLNHCVALNPISPGVMPGSLQNTAVAPPFLPPSITPLAQIQGNSMLQFDQTFFIPPPLTTLPVPQTDSAPPLPPQADLHPPLPSSPPPLSESQPPPHPSSSTQPPCVESSNLHSSEHYQPYKWQGTLSKSGVHYCTIYAQRLQSDICNYSNVISEPAEWPTKLDMMKRTDFRHVMSTFSSTPSHKREVCQLLPVSAGDHKGFQDFISYLKQRECAGVIKIPASRSVWARLLFILPYSQDICTMLSILPSPSDCLIALTLPKETNFEWV